MSPLSGPLLVGALVGLAQLDRKGFLQLHLAQPLFIAPAVGWLLGDLGVGLALAAPLSLRWLYGVNVGAALPEHEGLGAAVVTAAAILGAGPAGAQASTLVLAAILFLPAAALGQRVEGRIEGALSGLSARARRRVEAGASLAPLLWAGGLLGPLCLGALAALGASAGGALIRALGPRLPAALLGPSASLALLSLGAATFAAGVLQRPEPQARARAGGALLATLLLLGAARALGVGG